MQVPDIGEGLAIGVGKGTYRVGYVDGPALTEAAEPVVTPSTPGEFFAKTGQWLLKAANDGVQWAVLGIPGPVSVEVDHDDNVAQRLQLTNLPDLNPPGGFDPVAYMTELEPKVGELLASDFTFLTVNAGDLAAQAAAKHFGEGYDVVGDVINGNGTGSAIARRDKRFDDSPVFHPDPGLWEGGHTIASFDFPSLTPEARISGQALEQRYGKPAHELPEDHPVFAEIGRGIGLKVIELATLGGAELVVISGGIGINAQHNYREELMRTLEGFKTSDNPMAHKVPNLRIPPRNMADTYELYGAHGAMLSHLTRRAIDQLVLHAD